MEKTNRAQACACCEIAWRDLARVTLSLPIFTAPHFRNRQIGTIIIRIQNRLNFLPYYPFCLFRKAMQTGHPSSRLASNRHTVVGAYCRTNIHKAERSASRRRFLACQTGGRRVRHRRPKFSKHSHAHSRLLDLFVLSWLGFWVSPCRLRRCLYGSAVATVCRQPKKVSPFALCPFVTL